MRAQVYDLWYMFVCCVILLHLRLSRSSKLTLLLIVLWVLVIKFHSFHKCSIIHLPVWQFYWISVDSVIFWLLTFSYYVCRWVPLLLTSVGHRRHEDLVACGGRWLCFIVFFFMSSLGSMIYLYEGLSQTFYDWSDMISDLNAYVCIYLFSFLTIDVQGVILWGKSTNLLHGSKYKVWELMKNNMRYTKPLFCSCVVCRSNVDWRNTRFLLLEESPWGPSVIVDDVE